LGAVAVQQNPVSFGGFTKESEMQKQQRAGIRKGVPILMCGLLLLGACAHPIPAIQPHAAVGLPAPSSTIFVGTMRGGSSREIHAAVSAELAKSARYRLVDAEEAAEFVLTGGMWLSPQQTEAPEAWVELFSRATGAYVWQYRYRDQRSGNELFVPPAHRQVQIVVRQVVSELLTVATAHSARANASF
jgi:hypothetical protein